MSENERCELIVSSNSRLFRKATPAQAGEFEELTCLSRCSPMREEGRDVDFEHKNSFARAIDDQGLNDTRKESTCCYA